MPSLNRWLGDAPAVAKVITLTVGGTPTGGDKVTYTIGTAAISYTLAVSDTAALAAAGLYAALTATTDPRFLEVSWSYNTGDAFVTGTAATPGRPFTGTASSTGTTTLTQAVTTSSTGPNHVDEPKNWSLGALPVGTDDVLIDQGADGLWGFENLSAAAYNSFRAKASFEGQWGLPFTNTNGYVEYRGRSHPLATGIAATIGEGLGNGPTLMNLTVATAANLTVQKTGQRAFANAPAVNVSGMASGTLNVISGDVGLAADDDALAGTLTSLTCQENCTITTGKGSTVATLNNDGADVTAYGAVTTWVNKSGTATPFQAPTTITAKGGRVVKRFSGTVTTLTFTGGGDPSRDPSRDPVFDCTADPTAVTVTNGTFTGGAWINDPDQSTTWSNGFSMDQLSLSRSILGESFTVLRT